MSESLVPYRSKFVEQLITLAVILIFTDESVRKMVSGQSVAITAFKDGVMLLAGTIVIFMGFSWVPRYLVLWIPWVLVTFISCVYSGFKYNSLLGALAGMRSFCSIPITFVAFYYAGSVPELQRRIVRIFTFGSLIVILVVYLQETMRDALPYFLKARIYIEGHAGAGGKFADSLFAAPTTASVVTMTFIIFLLVAVLKGHGQSALVGLVIMALALASMFLIRIRVGVVLTGLGVALVVLLSRKAGIRMGRGTIRLVLFGAILTIVLAQFFNESADESVEHRNDRSFYSDIADPAALFSRLTFFIGEFSQYLPNHNPIYGYGAGTSSLIVMYLYDPNNPNVLAASNGSDTGTSMLWTEMGVLGIVAFVTTFLFLKIRLFGRILARSNLPPITVPAFVTSICVLCWFLFKAKQMMLTGTDQMIWIGSMAFTAAAVDSPEDSEDYLPLHDESAEHEYWDEPHTPSDWRQSNEHVF